MQSENNLYIGKICKQYYAGFGESTLLTTLRRDGDGQMETGEQALCSQLVLCPVEGC